jgi:2-keto-3-deoxy-L-rhamnonate aldolase RhmA
MKRSLFLAACFLPAALVLGQETAEWNNPVRAQLKEGKPVIGATITVAAPEIAAQAANMGFDFLWIEMEHSPITLETARNMILATRGLKAVPFIRVPVNELWTAKRALDAGSMGVIFPFTSTPELAKQAVAASRYAPAGRRGAGPGLASFRWQSPEGYYKFADRNAMVIAIVEDAQGLENIEEIAAVPGLDVIFIGTNDLSFSLGHGGQQNHPEVQKAIRRIVAAGQKNNVPLGRPAGTPELIQQYMKEGFLFFQGPSELSLAASGARPLLQSLDKAGYDPKTRPLY